jgi:hypothetical protein
VPTELERPKPRFYAASLTSHSTLWVNTLLTIHWKVDEPWRRFVRDGIADWVMS